MNYISVKGVGNLHNAVPRAKKKIYTPTPIRKDWDISQSVFRSYLFDNEDLLVKCFETDWQNSQVTKFIKNENDLEEVKQIMKQQYK